MKNLNPWARQAVEHWRKYRPKMYAQLFANGELYDRAQKAAEQTQQEYQDGITRGLLPHESWEAVRQNHIFLPTEEDVPHLGENPASSQDSNQSGNDYRITPEDHIGEGGPKQKLAFNAEATPILKALEAEARLIPFENPNSRPTVP